MQSHHLEVRSSDHPRADFARFAEADHREADGGKVAECADALDALAQILDLRH